LRGYFVASYAVGGVYLPFFPRWLEGRGIFGLRLGVICAAAPAMGLFAPAAFGVVADYLAIRVGILQMASAGALAAFGTLAVMTALHAPLHFHVIFLVALAFALFRSPMLLMADVVAIERAPKLGTTYGRIRLWGSLGFLGAALLGSLWVDPRASLPLPVACSAALAAGFATSLALPRRAEMPRRGDRRGIVRLLAEEDFRLLLIAAFLGQCGHVAYDMCFTLHLLDLGVPRLLVGFAWAIGTGAEAILMGWSAPAFRSFRAPRLLAIALAGAATRWVLLSFVQSSTTLLLLQPLHALSFGLVWLSAVSYTSQRFSSHSLATAQGLLVTAVGAGSIVGMLLWGSLYARAGGTGVFAGAACFAVVASAFAIALDRKVRWDGELTPR
jgi:PPP family 3-phenylpropionic acid transporter